MHKQNIEKGHGSACRNWGKMGSELRKGVAETPFMSTEHFV